MPDSQSVLKAVDRSIGSNRLATAVVEILEKSGARFWLVGGGARDAFLGRPVKDLDITMDSDPGPVCQELSKLGATVFPLDRQRGFYRAVSKEKAHFFIDLLRMRGASIEEDLAGRDFTINAMAVSLGSEPGLIDPHNGLDSLESGQLRPVSAASLADDPIRILRAHRLALSMNLSMAPELKEMISATLPLLENVAAERILAELLTILKRGDSQKALEAMAEEGCLAAVFPGIAHTLAIDGKGWKETLEAYGRLEKALEEVQAPSGYDREIGGGISIRELLKLACLFSFLDQPQTEGTRNQACEALEGLKAPGKAILGASLIGGRWKEPAKGLSASESFEWYTALGKWAGPALFFARAVTPPELVEQIGNIDYLEGRISSFETLWPPRKPLVTGSGLIRELGAAPGPELGGVLLQLKKAAYCGEIGCGKEALALAKKILGESGRS